MGSGGSTLEQGAVAPDFRFAPVKMPLPVIFIDRSIELHQLRSMTFIRLVTFPTFVYGYVLFCPSDFFS